MSHEVRLYYPEAAGGTFAVVSHGLPSSNPSVYEDYDCTVATSDRVITAAGRAKFFVLELVDVYVNDAQGNLIDTITEGVNAADVAIRSAALTGLLPSGNQGAGGLTYMPAALANQLTSFGARDFKVRETGQPADLYLKDALAAVRSANVPWFNVKASPYNASGAGTTNDATAVQAAISAAQAAGGGVVYMPRGTYLFTTGVSITHPKVIVIGDGEASSVINYTPAAGYAVTVNCATAAYCGNYLQDIGISAPNAGGLCLQLVATPHFSVRNCRLTAVTAGAVQVTTPAHFIENAVDVSFTTTQRGAVEVIALGLFQVATFRGNRFLGTIGGGLGQAQVRVGVVDPSSRLVFNGNHVPLVPATLSAITTPAQFTYSGNDCRVAVLVLAGAEAANIQEAASSSPGFSTLSVPIVIDAGAGVITGQMSSASRGISLQHAAGAIMNPESFALYQSKDLNATPVTFNAANTDNRWDGAELVFRLRNTTGAPIVINWNAVWLGSAAMGNLAAGQTRIVRFIRRENATAGGWRYAGHWDTT